MTVGARSCADAATPRFRAAPGDLQPQRAKSRSVNELEEADLILLFNAWALERSRADSYVVRARCSSVCKRWRSTPVDSPVPKVAHWRPYSRVEYDARDGLKRKLRVQRGCAPRLRTSATTSEKALPEAATRLEWKGLQPSQAVVKCEGTPRDEDAIRWSSAAARGGTPSGRWPWSRPLSTRPARALRSRPSSGSRRRRGACRRSLGSRHGRTC